MQLAKSIMLKSLRHGVMKIFFLAVFVSLYSISFAQDNSPYSRYGIGDLLPGTNMTTCSMGGISAGYADWTSVNFSNPASYSQFFALKEARSNKLAAGRVILDVGLNFDNHTLIEPNTTNRFSSSNALFSYVQLGLPLRRNWGLTFGLRPVSRISYDITRTERLSDPISGNYLDTAVTQFKGSGGAYLPTMGTGFGFNIGKSIVSFGANMGYLFGSRQTTALRTIVDTLTYNPADFTTNSSFGGLYFDAGFQFTDTVVSNKNRWTLFRIGVSGNWQQNINAHQDLTRQTYTLGTSGEEVQLDSVYQVSGVKGNLVYPASYKAGFVIQHGRPIDNSEWLIGVDYSKGKWSNYRFFGQQDSVQDNWMINVGGEFTPRIRDNYFSKATYRFGFYTGTDYIRIQNHLPVLGITAGIGLPLINYSRLSSQVSLLNIGFEYSKRGNNSSVLKENMFRLSVGFSFTDLWYIKKKYVD